MLSNAKELRQRVRVGKFVRPPLGRLPKGLAKVIIGKRDESLKALK